MASDKAKAVLAALNIAVGDSPTGTAPADIKVAASSDGDLTVESAGYTKSAYPDAITGFRGAILTTDDAELHVYTDIEDAEATPVGSLYSSNAGPGEPASYSVVGADSTPDDKDVPVLWSQVDRADDMSSTTGSDAEAVTSFAGSVRGLAGMFSCTGTTCEAPVEGDDGTITYQRQRRP